MIAAEIRGKRVEAMHSHRHWQWHLDELSGPTTSGAV